MSENSAITVSHLIKSVNTQEGELTILNGINMDVKQGESVAILGPSGSGKSTLLGLLAALDSPSQGSILLDGVPLETLNEESKAALRKKKVSFIFQSFMLVDTLNALENVMLPAELSGIANAKEKSQAMLERVGLSHRLNHFPNQLSGGEQQRVAIARAFICEPKVLFADEPTGNLDSANSDKIADMLFELNRESDTTLVLVTHDMILASRCQRQFIMDSGNLSEKVRVKPTEKVTEDAAVEPADNAVNDEASSWS